MDLIFPRITCVLHIGVSLHLQEQGLNLGWLDIKQTSCIPAHPPPLG